MLVFYIVPQRAVGFKRKLCDILAAITVDAGDDIRRRLSNKDRKRMNSGRKRTRNEKIFYVISLLIVVSMIVSLIAVAITPTGF